MTAGFKTIVSNYSDSLLAREHQGSRFTVELKQTCFGHPLAVYWVGRRDLYIHPAVTSCLSVSVEGQ